MGKMKSESTGVMEFFDDKNEIYAKITIGKVKKRP